MKNKDSLKNIQTEFKLETNKFSDLIVNISNDDSLTHDEQQEAMKKATKEFHLSYDEASKKIKLLLKL